MKGFWSPSKSEGDSFSFEWGGVGWGTARVASGILHLVGVQLGHFLHIDAYTLAVKEHKVHRFDGGGHRGHKVTGDGLQDELGCSLLREPIPAGEKKTLSSQAATVRGSCPFPAPPPTGALRLGQCPLSCLHTGVGKLSAHKMEDRQWQGAEPLSRESDELLAGARSRRVCCEH